MLGTRGLGARPWAGLIPAWALLLLLGSSCGGDAPSTVCGVDEEEGVCHCRAEERLQSEWRRTESCSAEDFPCCFQDLDNQDCFCTVVTVSTDPNAPPDCSRVSVRNARAIDSCP
jgi:hypothetical protein